MAAVHIDITVVSSVLKLRLMVRSPKHECESEYLHAGSSKRAFACISMAAVHIDTSLV